MESFDFIRRYQKIKYEPSKANLEEVTFLLDHYNGKPYVVDGNTISMNPLIAASFNQRYKELTGKDHAGYVKNQAKVLDEIIQGEESLSVNGLPSIYQRLKNNLTGQGIGILILPSFKGSYLEKFDKIQYDIGHASLEDVSEILNYYDQDSVLINGLQYHCSIGVLAGESLNNRYKELTGKDHPNYLKKQKRLLLQEMQKGNTISVNNQPSSFEQLIEGTMEVGNQDHVLTRFHKVLSHLDDASLEDVSGLLQYFNGNGILINGVVHHPFNDPISAWKLNQKYYEFTGEDHPVYLREMPHVIDELLNEEEKLVSAGAYPSSYFQQLEDIKEQLDAKRSRS